MTQRELERLRELPESELTSKIDVNHIFDDDAYFVRAEKYFTKYVKELRRNIDDTFSAYFEEQIRHTETTYGALVDISKYRELEDYSKKDLTRRGLDIFV